HTIKCTENLVHWEHLVHVDTLVVLMGMKSLSKIAKLLVSYGRRADTPVSVIENATYQSQKTVFGSLETIAEKEKSLSPAGTIVIGELAAKTDDLAWFQSESNTGNTAFDDNQRRAKFAV